MSCVQTRARTRDRSRLHPGNALGHESLHVRLKKLQENVKTDIKSCIFEVSIQQCESLPEKHIELEIMRN